MNKNIQEYPEVITIDQMCEILHIGKIKAYELLRTQTVKCLRIGKKYIIPRASVENLLDNIIQGIADEYTANKS